MRITLFIILNFGAAIATIVLSIWQGATIGAMFLRLIVVLSAIQALYVIWLLALAFLHPKEREKPEPKAPVGRTAKDP